MTNQIDKQATELAQAVGQQLCEHDQFSKLLGIRLEHIAPGSARVSVVVTKAMTNGHSICHGGVTFTLADTAFAYACNSRNHKTVALNCLITFVQPVHVGDCLTATAEEQTLKGRTGVYDITVKGQSEAVVALFRGTSYRLKEPVLQAL